MLHKAFERDTGKMAECLTLRWLCKRGLIKVLAYGSFADLNQELQGPDDEAVNTREGR